MASAQRAIRRPRPLRDGGATEAGTSSMGRNLVTACDTPGVAGSATASERPSALRPWAPPHRRYLLVEARASARREIRHHAPTGVREQLEQFVVGEATADRDGVPVPLVEVIARLSRGVRVAKGKRKVGVALQLDRRLSALGREDGDESASHLDGAVVGAKGLLFHGSLQRRREVSEFLSIRARRSRRARPRRSTSSTAPARSSSP